MAARKLGGGRILGSGKGLAPSGVPPHLQGGVNGNGGNGKRPDGYHSRSTSLLSVAESAQSAQSWQSTTDGAGSGTSTPFGTSPLPSQERLGERVEMGKGGGVSAVNTRLLCPICNEEMVSFTSYQELRRVLIIAIR